MGVVLSLYVCDNLLHSNRKLTRVYVLLQLAYTNPYIKLFILKLDIM